jgi:hypothetical protein
MRYWVYINGKVIEMPFEEGELSAIKGFNADTLVCKETPAPGESQEWMPAKMLIEAYKQPAPPPPPSKQIIEKFAAKPQDTFLKEPKGTILSSNIFGTEEKKEPENQPQQNNANTPFGQTEAIFPEETAQENKELSEEEKIKEELFSEPPTEVISFDKLEVFDVDKHEDEDNTESEEEILKTAIRTTISSKKTKKENQTLQAIDIVNNNNIDISDQEEEEKPEEVKSEEKPTKEKSQEESLKNVMPLDGEVRVLDEVAQKQDFTQTELTPLGAADKKPLTRLFDSEPVVEEQPAQQEQPVQEEQPTPQEQPVEEEEFNPEEEISLEDDNFIIDTNNGEKPVIENNTPAPKEVQEVLQEFAEENEVEIQDQKPLEDTFKTSPALVAELQESKPVKEVEPKQENDILDLQTQPQPDNIEEHPTTLEELTGRYPIEEETPVQQEAPADQPQENKQEESNSEENQPTGIVIPAEIHPDIIVEEIKEEGSEENQAEENIPSQKTQTIPEKDNFLNTFSSDIETVFLDQPTAFISDYIPPAETGEENNLQVMESDQKEGKPEILDIKSDQGQHQVSLQNVRRVKPAAIKTVPMVEGEHQDPFSQTQIQHLHDAEVAMAKVERNSNFINLLKTFGLLFLLLVMVMGFVALIAQINIIPKGFSPFHALYTSLTGGEKKKVVIETPVTPIDLAKKDLEEAAALRIKNLIKEVKDYQLPEGISLDEKIKLVHPNIYSQLKWDATQLPNDLTYYRVTVSSPTNSEGYAQVNYLFNYNTVTYTVEATNSEANNLMLTPYQKNVQQQQLANN